MKAVILFGAVLGVGAGSAWAQDRFWAAPVTGAWNSASNWNPADVPNGSESAIIDVPGTYDISYQLPFGGVDRLAILEPNASVTIASGRMLNVTTAVLNGRLRINWPPTSSNATVLLASGTSLQPGAGRIELYTGSTEANDASLFAPSGVPLTIPAGLEIAGSGAIGGTAAPAAINNGVVHALAGFGPASLTFRGGVQQGPGGLLWADGGSLLLQTGIAYVTGGRIRVENGGVLTWSSAMQLQNVVVDGVPSFNVPAGKTLAINGGVVINCPIRVNPENGAASSLEPSVPLAWAGGIVELSANGSIVPPSNGLVIGSGFEVRGEGGISVGNGTLTNSGTIRAIGATPLDFSYGVIEQAGGGVLVADAGTLDLGTGRVHGGVIRAVNSGRVQYRDLTLDAVQVEFPLDSDAGILSLRNVVPQGLVSLRSSAQLVLLDRPILDWPAGVVELSRIGLYSPSLRIGPGQDATIAPGFEVRGSGSFALENNVVHRFYNQGVIRAVGGTLDLNAQQESWVEQSGEGRLIADGAPLSLSARVGVRGGRIQILPGGALTWYLPLTLESVRVEGQLAIAAGNELIVLGSTDFAGPVVLNPARVQNTSTAILTLGPDAELGWEGGSLRMLTSERYQNSRVVSRASQLTVRPGFELFGAGLVRSTVAGSTFFNEGTVRADNAAISAGFTIEGFARYVQAPTATLGVSASANTLRRTYVEAPVELAGALEIAVDETYSPTFGDLIRFSQGPVTGRFDRIQFPALPAGLAMRLRYAPTGLFAAVTCASDYNADFVVDFFDYLDFVDGMSTEDIRADINADQVVDFFDYLDFVGGFSDECPG
jgi:hypothetical protein